MPAKVPGSAARSPSVNGKRPKPHGFCRADVLKESAKAVSGKEREAASLDSLND